MRGRRSQERQRESHLNNETIPREYNLRKEWRNKKGQFFMHYLCPPPDTHNLKKDRRKFSCVMYT